MTNLLDYKTVYELGSLPPIIADGKVFGDMTNPERKDFFKSVKLELERLEKISPEIKEAKLQRSQNHYKAMLLYPQERINKPFLERQRKDEMRWHFYVWFLAAQLSEFMMQSLTKFQDKHKKNAEAVKRLLSENKKAAERIEALKQNIHTYNS